MTEIDKHAKRVPPPPWLREGKQLKITKWINPPPPVQIGEIVKVDIKNLNG